MTVAEEKQRCQARPQRTMPAQYSPSSWPPESVPAQAAKRTRPTTAARCGPARRISAPAPRRPGAYIDKKWSSSVVVVTSYEKRSSAIAMVSGLMSATMAVCAKLAVSTAHAQSRSRRIVHAPRGAARGTSGAESAAAVEPRTSANVIVRMMAALTTLASATKTKQPVKSVVSTCSAGHETNRVWYAPSGPANDEMTPPARTSVTADARSSTRSQSSDAAKR
mmetsp:Transcript_8764/g.30156  ORF Transcript_8764/g.30156 Transcript_8764/m.30156 type:complete len:222 (-) Transcript_8764:385-1050(-)